MLKVIEVLAVVVLSYIVLKIVFNVVCCLILVADKVFPLDYDAAELKRRWRGRKCGCQMARQKRRARRNAERVRRKGTVSGGKDGAEASKRCRTLCKCRFRSRRGRRR